MDIDLDEPRYIKLLELIDTDGFSMGAGKAQEALASSGIMVSEPTAGRVLRDLERAGLLEKNGSHGRKLTSEGKRKLLEHQAVQDNIERARSFAESINPTEKEELLDILAARRAIEVELARMAASNITAPEIEKLRSSVEESRVLFQRGENISDSDTRFHMTIASASRNRTLAGALKLIWHDGRYAKKLAHVRYHSKNVMGDDHVEIIEALASGDTGRAGNAMKAHIDNVIRDVEKLPYNMLGDDLIFR
ncbi:MAG: FCD domain-containing protein [Synergistaceae bacterium]|jgi:GntR family L-lactate dehydrogenase operon transcriptional regulator|nr:FCD domain-containing protein [Synergistaceae bacterium]